ncbi:MAG: 3-phosphoshikimate 1-carboxyvinyltransferase [Nitrospira sp. NTP1]|nr:3-phosphoshikimate 1-carboxyvinyltransferase [Nitrospira sp. NTP1]
MASLTITPGRPLKGTITVPGDKSVTHRAIILTALAEGTSTVTEYCRGEDCLNTMRAFQSLGVRIEETPESLTVYGKGMWGLTEPFGPIDCGNSGTGIRLMAGLLAGQDFFTILTGDESIRRRPMGRVVKPLRAMGATIAGRKGGELAPLAITGTRLKGMSYVSPVASAQIKSSLLFAALYADGLTTISEPRLSRDHTERMLAYFEIPFERDGCTVRIEGRPAVRWSGKPVVVPGDLSAAAFFLVGSSIVPDSDVIEMLNPREEAGEPVADLRVLSRPLHGVRIGPDQIPQTIDEFPILCVAAAVAEGETVIIGAEELRVKESDRIATMATELRAMGARIEERPDGMVIQGLGRNGANGALTGAICESHGDHRVAMSVAIGGLTAAQATQILHTDCIETSFPNFDHKLLELLTDSGKRL